MNESFEILKQIVDARHTTKPAKMNGKKIDEASIHALLELANRAPSHGRTEPWRFVVLHGEPLQKFCTDHAEMYWEHVGAATGNEAKYNTIKNQPNTVSHLIVVVMQRTPNTKILMMEEYAAVCAATQNMLLGAEALGIAAIWSTGGLAHHSLMKSYLKLATEDEVVALLMLGYSDAQLEPIARHSSGVEKILNPNF